MNGYYVIFCANQSDYLAHAYYFSTNERLVIMPLGGNTEMEVCKFNNPTLKIIADHLKQRFKTTFVSYFPEAVDGNFI